MPNFEPPRPSGSSALATWAALIQAETMRRRRIQFVPGALVTQTPRGTFIRPKRVQ